MFVPGEATNEIGSRQHTFNVLVKGKIIIFNFLQSIKLNYYYYLLLFTNIAEPMITVSDKVVHGAIGNDVEIRCEVKAYPPVNKN